jgi:hypothetical protein
VVACLFVDPRLPPSPNPRSSGVRCVRMELEHLHIDCFSASSQRSAGESAAAQDDPLRVLKAGSPRRGPQGGRGAAAQAVIPSLTLTDLNSNLNPEQLFALQSALPTPIVVSPALPLVGLWLSGLYLGALAIMVQAVVRPTLSRMLRGDES